jgi:hypothetical protein
MANYQWAWMFGLRSQDEIEPDRVGERTEIRISREESNTTVDADLSD